MSDGTYGAPRIRAELADVDARQLGLRHVAWVSVRWTAPRARLKYGVVEFIRPP